MVKFMYHVERLKLCEIVKEILELLITFYKEDTFVGTTPVTLDKWPTD